MAEAPLAMLVECRYVVALKATTAFTPQSCDLSPFESGPTPLFDPDWQSWPVKQGKFSQMGNFRNGGLVWLPSAYFCQTKLLA